MAIPLSPKTLVEVLHPVTWFAPMWAFATGVVSSGVPIQDHWWVVLVGIVLAGPIVCGTSQAINDWFDRHVDAINEPDRPIPSGRIPGRWGLYIALGFCALSTAVAAALGVWVLIATLVGLVLAWLYSMPPIRLKQNGWWGNAAVAVSYEGLAWFTGATVMLAAFPDAAILWLAGLYSLGAHGTMTLNDFKAVEGDRRMGVRSLPVQLGVENAVRLACVVMAVPQLIVIGLLLHWGQPFHAIAVVTLVAIQLVLMVSLIEQPKERAPWYNATGTFLYAVGMLISAFAVRNVI
ncbi:MAG: chlorophyll synthase ChlG [Pseudomonadota bacterium]